MGDAKVAEECHPSTHLEDDVHQTACSVCSVGTVQCAGCKVGVPRWNGPLLQVNQELLHSATRHDFNAQEMRAASAASTIELQNVRMARGILRSLCDNERREEETANTSIYMYVGS